MWFMLIAFVVATWAVLSTLASERQIKVSVLQIERRRELDELERQEAAKRASGVE